MASAVGLMDYLTPEQRALLKLLGVRRLEYRHDGPTTGTLTFKYADGRDDQFITRASRIGAIVDIKLMLLLRENLG